MHEKPASLSAESQLPETPSGGMRVPFVRPALPDASVLLPAYAEIIASRQLTKGRYLERFELAIANRLGSLPQASRSSFSVTLKCPYPFARIHSALAVPWSCPWALLR